MAGANPTLSEAVVRNVMRKCTEVDHQSKLVAMTRDTSGHTHLRVRTGDVHSVGTLQNQLARMLPLAECNVSESWVDGTLEAEVTVFTADEECRRARMLITRHRLVSYWIAMGTICLLLGLGQWAAGLRGGGAGPHDEL